MFSVFNVNTVTYRVQKYEATLSPPTVHERRRVKAKPGLQEEAHVYSFRQSGHGVALFIYNQEPVSIRRSLLVPVISGDAAPPVSPLAPPFQGPFHVTARGAAAEGGPPASLSGVSAAVWAQLPGCDKESRKTRRFHTNYGNIMKPLVKGRRKVRLSLV